MAALRLGMVQPGCAPVPGWSLRWALDLCDKKAWPHGSKGMLTLLLKLYQTLPAKGLQAATGLQSSCPMAMTAIACCLRESLLRSQGLLVRCLRAGTAAGVPTWMAARHIF